MVQNPSSLFTDQTGKELLGQAVSLLHFTVNDGDIHQYAASYIPSHWHKELELFMLLEGHIEIGIGDAIYRLQAGDGCFINTEVIHSFLALTSSPCRFRSFVFHPDFISGTPGSIFDTHYIRPLLESHIPFFLLQEATDSIYFEHFASAFSACEKEYYGYEFQVRERLSQIALYIKAKSQATVCPTIPSIQEARLKEMLIWLQANLGKHLSVSDIAAAAHICPRECQRIFQQYLHYSPMEYLNQQRLLAAAAYLADTADPITDIALACGFSSPSYFSKQFKEMLGCTPSAYRAEKSSVQL